MLFIHSHGRKIAILAGCVPLGIGWLIVAHTNSYAAWCAARFLSGLSFGSEYTVLPVYLSEVSSDEVRGLVVFTLVAIVKCGLVTVFALGSRISVTALSYVGLLPLAVFAVGYYWLPESPYHLVACGRLEEARHCVRRLRGLGQNDESQRAADIDRVELAKISATLTEQLSMGAAFLELYRNERVRRSMCLMLSFSAILAGCGSQAMLSYTQVIFDTGAMRDVVAGAALSTSSSWSISPADASVLVAFVQLPSVVVASFVVDTFGRRPLVLISVTGTMLCNCAVSAIFWAQRHCCWTGDAATTTTMATLKWCMLAAMLVYFVCYVIGLCAVFNVFIGELFPTAVRACASATILAWAALATASVGKLFQVVSDSLGIEYTFGMFAIVGAVGLVYMWFELPETKGHSLADIQGRKVLGC